MTTARLPSRLAALALLLLSVASAASLAACGASVGDYCDYTDCSATPDAAADGAVLDAAGDAGTP